MIDHLFYYWCFAVLFVIDHYKTVNGNPVASVVVFVIFLVIYVWPTAIALRSSTSTRDHCRCTSCIHPLVLV